MPVYILAASRSETLYETVEWLASAGPVGWAVWGLYTAIVLVTEICVPALLVASSYRAQVDAERARVSEQALSGARAGSARETVLLELRQGPATINELTERTRFGKSTIRTHVLRLESEGHLTHEPGTRPKLYAIGKAA